MRISNASRLFLLVLLPCLLEAAPLLQVGMFSFPEFDASGAKIRKLESASASGSLEAPVLGKGALEFFGKEEGAEKVIGRLEFAEAIFDRARSTIHGPGEVHFRSEQGEVWGVGYSYDLATGELLLDSKARLRMPQGLVRAAKAEVWLDPKADAAGNIAVRRAEFTGGVEASELTDRKLGVERAETARASYNATDGLLRLASPVDVWRGGEKGRLESESITFALGPVLLPAKGLDPAPTKADGAEAIARP